MISWVKTCDYGATKRMLSVHTKLKTGVCGSMHLELHTIHGQAWEMTQYVTCSLKDCSFFTISAPSMAIGNYHLKCQHTFN